MPPILGTIKLDPKKCCGGDFEGFPENHLVHSLVSYFMTRVKYGLFKSKRG